MNGQQQQQQQGIQLDVAEVMGGQAGQPELQAVLQEKQLRSNR
jgi:hypothetical protein